jgi:hypothetical protein
MSLRTRASRTATGSSSSNEDEFARRRFPDGYRVELIERGRVSAGGLRRSRQKSRQSHPGLRPRLSLRLRVRGPLGRLSARPETQQAPAEGDCAHGEPSPAEREAGDHVCEPMHIEQYAARRDRDCKTDREAGERDPRRSSALAADQERHTA